ncbi:MAG: alpha/beta hydrolase [FCB group bacterium]|nr:alpha/beta hydrolase [FCB group bacterium]
MRKVIIFALMVLFIIMSILSCQKKTETVVVDIKQGIDSVASADGVNIVYEVSGTGSPALIMVHGWSCDRGYWREQVKEFSADYTVVTVDLGGHGQSGLNRKTWCMHSYSEDVVAVVGKLGLDSVILIGHSMGGSVILEAALRLKGKVIALVGVDTFNDLTKKYTPEEMSAFLQPFEENFANTTRLFVHSMFGPHADSALQSEIINDMAASPREVGLGSFEQYFPYYFGNPISISMKKANLPVRCINSDKYATNLEAGRAMAKSFEVKIMSGIGHFVHLEDPVTFNRLLHETLDELKVLKK